MWRETSITPGFSVKMTEPSSFAVTFPFTVTGFALAGATNYVYYVRNSQKKDPDTAFSFLNINTNSLCRIRRTGGDSVKILDSSRCSDASLIGNYLYYLRSDKNNSTVLSKIRLDCFIQGILL